MRRPITATLLIAAASLELSPACAGLAAGPAAGPSQQAITRDQLARGTAPASYEVEGAAGSDVVVQAVTIEPGGSAGWHTHPGSEVAVIKAGTLTLLDGDKPDCAATTIRAGEVFVGSGHPHMGRNTGSDRVELVVTYVNVPRGGAAATPVQPPAQCEGK